MKSIWIAWEKHRRTSELAESLGGAKAYQFEMDAGPLLRYPCLLWKTILTLWKERPDMVVVQNPSLILSLFMVTLGKKMVRSVVVDAHNEGIKPFYQRLDWLLPVYRMVQRRADLTLVTNGELARTVSSNGGRPFVMEDRIPVLGEGAPMQLKGKKNVVLICTFEKDEPFGEAISAASLLEPSIYVYVSGRYQKAGHDIVSRAPSNVIFTGFLPEEQYVSLLRSCDAIIDLTLMADCLVCGAYEAVAVKKPLILSDTPALRKYFCRGAVYTENKAEPIARAIEKAIEQKAELTKEMEALRDEIEPLWQEKLRTLVSVLDTIVETRKQ